MEDRYIRMATTLYKIVRKPLLSGDFMEFRVPWNRRQTESNQAGLNCRGAKEEGEAKDRNEIEFFAKFVLNSNNELNPIYIEQGETRYWVRKIPTLASDNPNLLSEMKKELPALLWNLQHRKLTTTKESQMWFRHDLLITNALRKMINHNRNKAENEMLQILAEIMEVEQLTELMFCVVDMVNMLEIRGMSVEHPHLRRILQHNWELQPSPTSQYYSTYALRYDGSTERKTATGRYYTITKEQLNAILLVC